MSNRCHWSACSFERNVLGRVIFPEALMHRKYMFRYILNGIRKVKYITVYKKKNALKYINLQPIICLFIRYVIVPDFFSMVVVFFLFEMQIYWTVRKKIKTVQIPFCILWNVSVFRRFFCVVNPDIQSTLCIELIHLYLWLYHM